MSVFAITDYESELQLNDKTRFDASKCFSSKATTSITALTVKPGEDGSATSVFDADFKNWMLDWVFTAFKIDVDSNNDDINFKVGSTSYTANVAAASYSLSGYLTAVASAMNGAYSNSFSLTSDGDDKVTITGTNAFELVASSVVTQLFLTTGISKVSHTGKRVEYGIRIITTAASNASFNSSHKAYVKVYSELGDRLFSTDQDLVAHEGDILKWVKDGRSSFKDVYRRAQKLIIAWLDQQGYVNAYREKYTKNDIIDLEEVRQWSTFMSLRIIFEGISNSTDDVFSAKAQKYSQLEQDARHRTILRIDFNKDGVADSTEGVNIYSGSLFRR